MADTTKQPTGCHSLIMRWILCNSSTVIVGGNLLLFPGKTVQCKQWHLTFAQLPNYHIIFSIGFNGTYDIFYQNVRRSQNVFVNTNSQSQSVESWFLSGCVYCLVCVHMFIYIFLCHFDIFSRITVDNNFSAPPPPPGPPYKNKKK